MNEYSADRTVSKSKPIVSTKIKHDYKFYEFEEHASWWTFEDEESVRELFYYPYLKKGMTVLDVGSAYGSYTLPALARGCKVIAINSPHAEIYEIEQNVKVNGPKFEKNFILYSQTVAAENGEVKIDMAGRTVLTPCKSIDYLLKPYKNKKIKIDFIKMDVEGLEVEVLKGATNTIITNKPIMLIENHLFHDAALQDKVIDFVKSLELGYEWKSQPYHAISHTLFIPISIPLSQ